MNEDDGYGSKYREAMKKSMEEPFSPLNRRLGASKAILATERRRRWIKSFWITNKEYIYVVVIAVVTLGAGFLAWLTMDRLEGLFRPLN